MNFLTSSDVERLARDAAFVREYFRKCRHMLAAIMDRPFDQLNTTWLLMPAFGSPNMRGMRVTASEDYVHEVPAGSTHARLIFVPLARCECTVQLGPFELSVRSDENGHSLRVDGRSVPVAGHIELNLVLREAAGIYLFDELLSVAGSSVGPIRIGVTAGEVAMVQAQVLGAQPSVSIPEDPEIDLGPTPYLKRWGKDSHRLYQWLLHAKLCQELSAATGASPKLKDRMERFARASLESIGSWPVWTETGLKEPSADRWNWNNWATGFVGGSYAVAASILGEETDEARRAFFERSTAWLASPYFPGPKRWVRRSINHGVVVYGSQLVGAFLLGLQDTPEVERLRLDLRQVLKQVLSDGSFVEGVNYYRFSMDHAFFYYWLAWRSHPGEWREFAADQLDFLKRAPAFLAHASSSDGKPWLRFGERSAMDWNRTSCVRLTLVAAGRPAGSYHLPTAPTIEAIAPLAWLAPVPEPEPERAASVLVHFEQNGLAGVDYFDEGRKCGTLSVLGSLLQLTHNNFHDCGGFGFETRGQAVVGIIIPTDPASAAPVCTLVEGDLRVPQGRRDYEGTIEARTLAADVHVIRTRVRFPGRVWQHTGLVRLVRTFVAVGAPDPTIFVVSAAVVKPWAKPVLRLNECGHSDYRIEARDAVFHRRRRGDGRRRFRAPIYGVRRGW